MKPIIYQTGHRFGKWSVRHQGKSTRYGIVWVCECECGNVSPVQGTRLRNGKSNSCGCTNVTATINAHWKGYGEIGKNLFTSYERSAAKRSIQFNVTIEEIWKRFLEQHRLCAITNIPLTMYSRIPQRKGVVGNRGGIVGSRVNGTASLDRIDSTKGYTMDNVQWVHKRINVMKLDMSQEEFIEWCELVVSNN